MPYLGGYNCNLEELETWALHPYFCSLFFILPLKERGGGSEMRETRQRSRPESLLLLQALRHPEEEQVQKMGEPFGLMQSAHGHFYQILLLFLWVNPIMTNQEGDKSWSGQWIVFRNGPVVAQIDLRQEMIFYFNSLNNCDQPKLAVNLIIFIACPYVKSQYLKHRHEFEIHI